MNIREYFESDDHEIIACFNERAKCSHTEHDGIVVDFEIVKKTSSIYEIYNIKKCRYGHYFKVFVKSHIISNETLYEQFS